MEIDLRPYQTECLNIIDKLDGGSHLVHLATGLGKTVIFSHIKRRGRVLILSHRDELVHQPQKYYDCSFGVEQSTEHSNGEEVVSASVHTLVRRLDRFKPDDFDIIITDEAHHSVAATYQKIYEYFSPRLHLGFTATPNRADKKGLDKIYEDIIFSRDLKWGIDNGYLCDINCIEANIDYDLSKVSEKNGDFDIKELNCAINQTAPNKGIAKAYRELAVGQTIIFATSTAHAKELSKEIEGSVVVSAKTQNRGEIIRAFTERKIRCLINCMVFTEGTDIPLIETVIIARPTKNVSLYQQMVGRGLRLSEGKKFLTLIDCVGVSDELRICTAPSLLGIDKKSVPKESRDTDGMLSNILNILSEVEDLPDAWTVNAEYVKLFARENGLNTYGVNWFLHCDSSMSCYFSFDEKLKIFPVNDLGKTYAAICRKVKSRYSYSLYTYPICDEMPLQDVLLHCLNYLKNNYKDMRAFWDLEIMAKWSYKPASEKQKAYIRQLINHSKFCSMDLHLDYDNMTKAEASQIINRLQNF